MNSANLPPSKLFSTYLGDLQEYLLTCSPHQVFLIFTNMTGKEWYL